MNRSGSSAQQTSNCSLVMNIVQDSERAFPFPRFALPAATPASTRTRLMCQERSNSCAAVRWCDSGLLRAVARYDMTGSSR